MLYFHISLYVQYTNRIHVYSTKYYNMRTGNNYEWEYHVFHYVFVHFYIFLLPFSLHRQTSKAFTAIDKAYNLCLSNTPRPSIATTEHTWNLHFMFQYCPQTTFLSFPRWHACYTDQRKQVKTQLGFQLI